MQMSQQVIVTRVIHQPEQRPNLPSLLLKLSDLHRSMHDRVVVTARPQLDVLNLITHRISILLRVPGNTTRDRRPASVPRWELIPGTLTRDPPLSTSVLVILATGFTGSHPAIRSTTTTDTPTLTAAGRP